MANAVSRALLVSLAVVVLLPAHSGRAATCAGPQRCDKQIVAETRYNYGIAPTSLHCDGLPSSCPPSATDDIQYSWPVTNAFNDNVSHQALDGFLNAARDQLFTLPFVDTSVKRVNGWLYQDHDWHHAFDFARDDAGSFPVRAAADGRVIFADWDPWSGNTVIVSHDAGSSVDAYRTIYMHMRNGPANDCDKSWTAGVNAISDQNASERRRKRDEYKAHLRGTGCLDDKALRQPLPAYWGTNDDRLAANLAGRSVKRGDQLGWAGLTGPGGQGKPGRPNTHLHVFFARRHTDGRWYFFDPYGIYGLPRCYPGGITEKPEGYCVRLPVAWKDGRPQYPAPSGCGNGPACPPGLRCTSGVCAPPPPSPPPPPGCVQVCPLNAGCFLDPAGACRRSGTERVDCSGPAANGCLPPCFRVAGGQCKVDVPRTCATVCQ